MATTKRMGRLVSSWRLLVLAGLVIAASVGVGVLGQDSSRLIVEHNGVEISDSNKLKLGVGDSATLTVRTSAAPSDGQSLRINIWDFGSNVRFQHANGPHNQIVDFHGNEWKSGKQVTIYATKLGATSLHVIPASHSQQYPQLSVPLEVPPPPSVTVNAGSQRVVEGKGNAKFTVTATPAATASVTYSVTAVGADVDASHLGRKTKSTNAQGKLTVTVPTNGQDGLDPDGSITLTVDSLDGAQQAGVAATVKVIDVLFGNLIGRIQQDISHYANDYNPPKSAAAKFYRRVKAAVLGEPHHPDDVSYWQSGCGTGKVTISCASRSIMFYRAAKSSWRVQFWKDVRHALCIRTGLPLIDISTSGPISETGNAVFTLTANPVPTTSLSVRVNVSQKGDYAESDQLGYRTVTIAAGATETTFPVELVDDNIIEDDGVISASVSKRSGYESGRKQHASVRVTSDDVQSQSMPAMSIAATANAVDEGSQITLTLTANPAPSSATTVTVDLTTTDVTLASGQAETLSVTIPDGSTTATATVDTVDDGVGGPDGRIVATIANGDGTTYKPGKTHQVEVEVRDINATSDLERRIKDAIEEARDDQVWLVEDLYRRALAAVRGETPPPGINILCGSDCHQVDRHCAVSRIAKWQGVDPSDSSGRVQLWTDIKPAIMLPSISVSATSGPVSEGGTIAFTVTANPAVTYDTWVTLRLDDSNDYAEYAIAGGFSNQSIVIRAGDTEATFSIDLDDDDNVDNGGGTVKATLIAGRSYELGSSTSVIVSVNDAGVVQEQRQQQQQLATQSDTSALEALVQARIDKTASNNDRHSNRIWRGAMAALRGEPTPNGARNVDAAFAQRLANRHDSKGRTELAELWQDIADALSN